ncbi:MAG: hypothetical protein KGL39_10330 [Patescibacteria group bacterium]|nr:hypothetical protein [Patescibacteria group bacterium]
MEFIGVTGMNEWRIWSETAKIGLYFPLDKIIIVGSRPSVILKNKSGLHADGKAALQYADGFSIYALNGIQMNPEYVLTPPEKLDCQSVLKEQNTDVRRELIRKIGIERMLSVLPNKILSRRGNYQLLSINLGGDATDARYLKMLNPSIGVWHLEGVAPECDTVEKSLNWRNQNKFVDAEILT